MYVDRLFTGFWSKIDLSALIVDDSYGDDDEKEQEQEQEQEQEEVVVHELGEENWLCWNWDVAGDTEVDRDGRPGRSRWWDLQRLWGGMRPKKHTFHDSGRDLSWVNKAVQSLYLRYSTESLHIWNHIFVDFRWVSWRRNRYRQRWSSQQAIEN